MKIFSGVDITENKDNEEMNNSSFVVARPSEIQREALDKATDEILNGYEKAKLPKMIRIVLYALVFAALFGVMLMVEAVTAEGNSFFSVYRSVPWLFWLAGAICLIATVAVVFAVKRVKTALASDEMETASRYSDAIVNNIFAEYGVSGDAKDVEILSVSYKNKNGELKLKKEGFVVSAEAYGYKAYRENDNLILADSEAKYAFPIGEMRAIKTVSERLSIPYWSKDEDHNKGEYKKYKLQEGKYGDICMKTYHILELEHENELWSIYFPCYELPAISELTGLTAE